jgi:molybdate transport system ATP-binding protein
MKLQLQQVQLPLASFTLELDAAIDRPVTGVFGPSGSGKTSLLDLIAGLRRPIAGKIQLGDEVLFDSAAGVVLPSRLRRIGYVPQDLALFPHLRVRANLLYGYRPSAAQNELFTLSHVADVMEISPLLDRATTNLSGGEQQRVAFARAILSSPRLILLDEPMSSLDRRLKTRLVPFLQRIRDEFRIPFIYVTHDASELSALCDEVLLLEQGRMAGRGSPSDALPAILDL